MFIKLPCLSRIKEELLWERLNAYEMLFSLTISHGRNKLYRPRIWSPTRGACRVWLSSEGTPCHRLYCSKFMKGSVGKPRICGREKSHVYVTGTVFWDINIDCNFGQCWSHKWMQCRPLWDPLIACLLLARPILSQFESLIICRYICCDYMKFARL